MNKREAIEQTHEWADVNITRADTTAVIDAFLDTIEAAIEDGDTVALTGFCKFMPVDVAAKPRRRGINSFTGVEGVFKAKPASTRVKITALKRLKEAAVRGGRSRRSSRRAA